MSLNFQIIYKTKLRKHKIKNGEIRYEDTITTDTASMIDGLKLASKGVNDGNGFVFISHIGDVMPSGLLPIVCGNVRETPLSKIYRESKVFKDLRQPDNYKGKCGVCEFRYICGGSRSRAYAVTGYYMENEPFCVYISLAIRKKENAPLS
jgi:radical SAM protein with 4Fe4S-binding SPASM domain